MTNIEKKLSKILETNIKNDIYLTQKNYDMIKDVLPNCILYLIAGTKGFGKSRSAKEYIYNKYLQIDYHHPYKFAWIRTNDESAKTFRKTFLNNVPMYEYTLTNSKGDIIESEWRPAFLIDGKGFVRRINDKSNKVVGVIFGLSVWENYRSNGEEDFEDMFYDEFNQKDKLNLTLMYNFWDSLLNMFSTLRRENVYGMNKTRLIILGNQDSDNNFILNALETFGYDNDNATTYLRNNPKNVFSWVDDEGTYAVSIIGIGIFENIKSMQPNDALKRLASANVRSNAMFNTNDFSVENSKYVKSLIKFDYYEIMYRFIASPVSQMAIEFCLCKAIFKNNPCYLFVDANQIKKAGHGSKLDNFTCYSLSRISDINKNTEIIDENDFESICENFRNYIKFNECYYSDFGVKYLIELLMVKF